MSWFDRWQERSSIVGAALMVMGTCIGAGTLVFPVGTALLGFWGTLGIVAFVWWFMYYAGLLVCEAASHFHHEASFLTMSKQIFGPWIGKFIFFAFLGLLYTLLAAYFVGGSDLVRVFVHFLNKHSFEFPPKAGMVIWGGIGLLALGWRMRSVDYLNRLCVMALLSTMLIMLISLSFKMDANTLWSHAFHWHPLAFPLVMVSFGYQVIVPSVRQYLKGNARSVLIALAWGTLVPSMIYLAWCYEIFAILPATGTHSLLAWASSPDPAYSLPVFLREVLDHPWFSNVTTSFVFFAMISSFLGILVSLYDLINDGVSQSIPLGKRHGVVMLLVVVPSFCYALFFHDGFMLVMRYAGALVALLNGFLPSIMVYQLRKSAPSTDYKAPGGLLMLYTSIVFFLTVFFMALIY